jgi:O-acetyl-ADP-ribose deacetylase (regulator of RNase III)
MITYITGDATDPQGDGRKLILHCCNDVGAWGAGFVLALSRRWPEPEREYLRWSGEYRESDRLPLGGVQIVDVGQGVRVANLIGQSGCGSRNGTPPVRYEAIRIGLRSIASSLYEGESIHCPRFGCGLAGGKWEIIEGILNDLLPEREIYVYDLPAATSPASNG